MVTDLKIYTYISILNHLWGYSLAAKVDVYVYMHNVM